MLEVIGVIGYARSTPDRKVVGSIPSRVKLSVSCIYVRKHSQPV